MKKSLKTWISFPLLYTHDGDHVYVKSVEYMGTEVRIGDTLTWKSNKSEETFIVKDIQLTPSIRFWSEKTSYLANNCFTNH